MKCTYNDYIMRNKNIYTNLKNAAIFIFEATYKQCSFINLFELRKHWFTSI